MDREGRTGAEAEAVEPEWLVNVGGLEGEPLVEVKEEEEEEEEEEVEGITSD